MFWEKFSELCKNANVSASQVVKELSLSSSSVTSWKKGKVPHHGTLLKIAEYFGVSVDYLLGKDGEAPPPVDPVDAEIAELWGKLTEEQQADVVQYIEFLRAKNNGK